MACRWGSPSSHGLFPDPGCRGLCVTTEPGQRIPGAAGGPRCRDPGQAPLPSPSPRWSRASSAEFVGITSPRPRPAAQPLWARSVGGWPAGQGWQRHCPGVQRGRAVSLRLPGLRRTSRNPAGFHGMSSRKHWLLLRGARETRSFVLKYPPGPRPGVLTKWPGEGDDLSHGGADGRGLAQSRAPHGGESGRPCTPRPREPLELVEPVTFLGAPVTGLLPSPTALSSRGLTLRFRVCEDGVAFSPVSLCSVHGVFLLGPKSKALPGG